MFKTVLRAAALAAAIVAAPGLAAAVTFGGNWEITQKAATDPGLVVSSSSMGGAFSTGDLAVGDSHVFKLFRLWTDERSVNDDDLAPQPIKVSFSLAAPWGGSGVAQGATSGHQGPIFDRPQKGVLSWDSPLELGFGKGGKVSITLMGGDFNEGLFDLKPGERHGIDVKARLTYESAPAPVPVPAALPLLMGGLGILGVAARRRRPAAA